MVLFSFIGVVYGQSFTPITQSISNTFDFAEISEANNVAIVGGAFVTKSLDGGWTWTQMPLGFEGFPWTTYDFIDVAIINPTTYCLVGKDAINNRAKIIRTTDGGANWTNVFETAVNSGQYLTHIIYNGIAVIAAGNDGIYRSTDQGQTWSFVSVNSGYLDLLEYNTANGNIIATYTSSGTIRESSDNGMTWIYTSWPSIGGIYSSITHQNGEYFLFQSANSTKHWYTIDQNNVPLDTTTIQSTLFQSTPWVNKSYKLTNGTYFHPISNGNQLYNSDPVTGNVYLYNYYLEEPGGLQVPINDIDVDQTYGLLVGDLGALTRFDLTGTADIFLPPDYTLTGSYTCPGDTIKGSADYAYADSVQWYFDGNLVSTDTNLIYPTPTNFGTYDLVFNSWVNGSYTSDTTVINFAPLNPTPDYSFFTYDSTPCYNNGIYYYLTYQSGQVSGSSYEIWQDSNLIVGPNSCSTSTFSQWSTVIASQDTFYTIISRPQQCGTYYDTLSFVVYPGDDLSDNYTLLPNDSIHCSGSAPVFELLDTDTTCTYEFTMTNSYNGSTWTQSYTGIYNDTLFITGGIAPIGYSIFGDVYTYYEVSISNNDGCAQNNLIFDTVIIRDPRSIFYPHSQNFYTDDTLLISNANVRDNRNWSVDPADLNISNINDTVPVILGNTTGYHNIMLVNEPLQACIDSSYQIIQVADSLEQDTISNCWNTSGSWASNLHKMKMDPQGNVVTLGVYKAWPSFGSGTPRPGFVLTKYDQNGNLLWEKKADAGQFSFYLDGVVIEAFDFDDNGDIYCAIWVEGNYATNYTQEGLVAAPGPYDYSGYLIKVDGQTGTILWSQDLSDYSSGQVKRVSDLIVSGQKVHVSTSQQTNFEVITMDLNGNFLFSDQQGGSSFFLPNAYHIPNGANGGPRESHHCPQMVELSTGEIVCVAYYAGTPYLNGSPVLQAASFQVGAILVVKYNDVDGFYDLEKVATHFDDNLEDNVPHVAVDSSDNINIAITKSRIELAPYAKDTLWIKDSAIVVSGNTVLFQLNDSYDLNWISTGNYAIISDLDVAMSTGDIILSGQSAHNIGFTTDSTSAMMGYYGDYTNEYGTNPYYWELESYYIGNKRDLFTFRFDKNGIPKNGRFFMIDDSLSTYPERNQIESAVTPCGDIVCALNNKWPQYGSNYYIVDGVTYSLDSSIIMKFAGDCVTENCTYLTINTDTALYCIGTDSSYISFSQSYNVDSISYILLDNGAPVGNYTVTTNGNGFYLQNPSVISNFEIAIYDPIIDTITLAGNTFTAPTYTYIANQCIGDNQVISASPIAYSYLWNDTLNAGTYNFDAVAVGNFGISVLASDINGCKSYDTLNIVVNAPISPTFDTSYFVNCFDQLVIPFNNSDYTSENWVLNGLSSTNYFDDNNLNVGMNNVEVALVDSNGCSGSYYIGVEYCISGLSDFPINGVNISPNPSSNGKIFIDLPDTGEDIAITIISENGHVLDKISTKNSMNYNIDGAKGIYFVVVDINRHNRVFKIVKQ